MLWISFENVSPSKSTVEIKVERAVGKPQSEDRLPQSYDASIARINKTYQGLVRSEIEKHVDQHRGGEDEADGGDADECSRHGRRSPHTSGGARTQH